MKNPLMIVTSCLIFFICTGSTLIKEQIGVGAKAPKNAIILFDGSRKMLDEKWTYWEGPRFSTELPIKWKIVNDPVDPGTVVNSDDPSAAGGILCLTRPDEV